MVRKSDPRIESKNFLALGQLSDGVVNIYFFDVRTWLYFGNFI